MRPLNGILPPHDEALASIHSDAVAAQVEVDSLLKNEWDLLRV